MRLTEDHAALAKSMLARGDRQHDIAAFFGVNAGRIAEIAKGYRFSDVRPAPKRLLPVQAAMTSGVAVHEARAALRLARIAIDSALARLDEWEEKRDGQ